MPGKFRRLTLIAIVATTAAGLAGCTDYGVPGGDRPWPKLHDFPERPDEKTMDERRRRLLGQYGNLDEALPEPAVQPARPPAGALKVAVIYFSRADATLDENARDVLTRVAEYANKAGGAVWLFGYASAKLELTGGGSAFKAQRDLSGVRVREVALALAKSGVPVDKLQLVARGAYDPAYLETQPTGEAGNRRVEIYFAR